MKKTAILLVLALACSLPLVTFAGNDGKTRNQGDVTSITIEGEVTARGCDDDGDGKVTVSECENECGGIVDLENGICWVNPQ